MTRTGKIMPLPDAVRENVRPGDHIHASYCGGRPNAALRAIAGAFWGTTPEFTISSTAVGGSQVGLFLLAGGLIKKIIAGFVGHQYPAPRPSSLARRLVADGSVELEAWSLLTLLERLRAAAHGLEWTVTRSLRDESLPSLGSHLRRVVVEPEGVSCTLIPALHPDVALVHGVIADESGNTVLGFPYAEGVLGALAARRGAIVTVERLVSRAELRRYAHLPTIPSVAVRSVSLARGGAHPSGIYADAIDQDLSYSDDYNILREMVEVLESDAASREEWSRRWLLDVADPAVYLERVGQERLADLNHWWRASEPEHPVSDAPASDAERMIVAAAGVITSAWQRDRPEYIFAGIGASSLAVWLVAVQHPQDPPLLLSELGYYDYWPRSGDPWLFSFGSVKSCSGLTDTATMLSLVIQGRGGRGMAVLSAGQADRQGRINTSWAEGKWLTGSGGANDVASVVEDVTVLVPHSPRRLVPAVEYVTSPGANVTRIVTDLAVLERCDDEFVLTGVLALERDDDVDTLVANARSRTPWELRIARTVACLPLPSDRTLRTLRSFDPHGFFTGTPPLATAKPSEEQVA